SSDLHLINGCMRYLVNSLHFGLYYLFDNLSYQFTDIDQINFAILINCGFLAMRKLMATSRNKRIIIRPTKRSEHIRDNHSSELTTRTSCPVNEQLTAFLLRTTIGIIPFLLRRG